MTIRGLLKKELKAKGYPVEISTEGTKHCHTKGLGWKHITTKGIGLERELFKNREGCRYLDTELLTVRTNGYITEDEVQSIIDDIMKTYKPYRRETKIFIYETTAEDYEKEF